MNYTNTVLLFSIFIALCAIGSRLDDILNKMKDKETDENQETP